MSHRPMFSIHSTISGSNDISSKWQSPFKSIQILCSFSEGSHIWSLKHYWLININIYKIWNKSIKNNTLFLHVNTAVWNWAKRTLCHLSVDLKSRLKHCLITTTEVVEQKPLGKSHEKCIIEIQRKNFNISSHVHNMLNVQYTGLT